MIIQVGNTELNPEWIALLSKHFTMRFTEDDEIFLKTCKDSYTGRDVFEILTAFDACFPDEISIEDDELRLWWD